MAGMLADAAAVEFGSRDPWPGDVKLYIPYESQQVLMCDFASCLSVKTFLNMCKLPYNVVHRTNVEQMSPSGKAPFLLAGRYIVSEFQPIVSYIATKGGSLSSHLTELEKADMKAYIAMIENYLGNAELYLCFNHKDIYEQITVPRCGSSHVWPLTYILPHMKRSDALKKLNHAGWKDKTLQQVWEDVEKCLRALSEKLGDKEYFFGDTPSDLDAVAYGHLFTLVTTHLPLDDIRNCMKEVPNLMEFVVRIDSKYFDGQLENTSPR